MVIASAFEAKVNNLLTFWVSGVVQAFTAALIPLAALAFTIYIILLGWRIMRGEAHDPVQQIVKRLFTLAVIGGIALSFGVYNQYVLQGTYGAINGLVGIIELGDPSLNGINNNNQVITLGGLIDGMMTPYTNLYNQITKNFTVVPDFALILSAFIVAVAEVVVVFVTLGFYMLARVELSLCLAIGPLFVLFAALEPTREWTRRWIGQLWHHVLQVGLLAACITLLQSVVVFVTNTALTSYVNNGAASVFSDVFAVIVVSFCVCVIVWNIGALAQALTGAVGGIGHDAVQAGARTAGSAVWGGAGLAMDAASGGARAIANLAKRLGSNGGPNQIAPSVVGASDIPAAQRHVLENL